LCQTLSAKSSGGFFEREPQTAVLIAEFDVSERSKVVVGGLEREPQTAVIIAEFDVPERSKVVVGSVVVIRKS
jgi:hypothetical protein